MIRAVSCVALLLWWLAFVPGATAARYTCSAARELATLGARDSDSVVITPDDANSQCRFSVNGEPAGSPPAGALLEAINILRVGAMSNELYAGNVRPLGLLLLAASPEEELSNRLEEQLFRWAKELGDCFASLERGPQQRESFPELNAEDVICRLLPPGETELDFVGEDMVSIGSRRQFVVVAVRREESSSFFFVPDGAFVGRLPFQP